jgi:hypothetical protein
MLEFYWRLGSKTGRFRTSMKEPTISFGSTPNPSMISQSLGNGEKYMIAFTDGDPLLGGTDYRHKRPA